MALVTCPTSSIGTTRKLDARAVVRALPEPLVPGGDEVYFCGWSAESSYGAASWPSGGPRATCWSIGRAARTLPTGSPSSAASATFWLSHRDDVADHQALHDRFACERILHRADLGPDTRDVERILDGDAPIPRSRRTSSSSPSPDTRRQLSARFFARRYAFTGRSVGRTSPDRPLEPATTSPGLVARADSARWPGSPSTASRGCCPATAGGSTPPRRRDGGRAAPARHRDVRERPSTAPAEVISLRA